MSLIRPILVMFLVARALYAADVILVLFCIRASRAIALAILGIEIDNIFTLI